MPFVIDDKHRGEYLRGIAAWDTNPERLTSVVTHTQPHFEGKMDLCRLFQYQRAIKPKESHSKNRATHHGLPLNMYDAFPILTKKSLKMLREALL